MDKLMKDILYDSNQIPFSGAQHLGQKIVEAFSILESRIKELEERSCCNTDEETKCSSPDQPEPETEKSSAEKNIPTQENQASSEKLTADRPTPKAKTRKTRKAKKDES